MKEQAKHVTLDDLPQFRAVKHESTEQGEVYNGFFNTLEGVDAESWLFDLDHFIQGDVKILNPETKEAEFRPHWAEVPPAIFDPGLPWMMSDGWYQPRDVRLALDETFVWTEHTFHARDAYATNLENGLRSLQPGIDNGRSRVYQGQLEPGATQYVVPGGWDHEHCFVCNVHIDEGKQYFWTEYYDTYCCVACYERWVLQRDMGFIFGHE
ncbi:MAG: hypothetical protein JSS72_03860 [Armatimonadetes bacterium]|nr:hypothetical protein [Armatimonadota bacterium]